MIAEKPSFKSWLKHNQLFYQRLLLPTSPSKCNLNNFNTVKCKLTLTKLCIFHRFLFNLTLAQCWGVAKIDPENKWEWKKSQNCLCRKTEKAHHLMTGPWKKYQDLYTNAVSSLPQNVHTVVFAAYFIRFLTERKNQDVIDKIKVMC